MTQAPFAASADCYQARIADPNGTIRGSGVLISYRHVLTCAHVLSGDDDRPTQDFVIEFPRSGRQPALRGRVPADGWLPESAGDIAILEFDIEFEDNLIRPARLGVADGTYGRPALAYGHPVDARDGLWARMDISHSTGPHGERIQLVPRPGVKADRIAAGFSGGPVIDEITTSVIGIVVSTFREPDWVAGWMIPIEVVARRLRQVRAVMPESVAGEPDIDPVELDRLADTLGRLPHLASPTGRQRVADRLPAASQARLPHPPPSAHDLVHACSRPSELRVLIDLVQYFDPDSLWDNRLERQLELVGVVGAETVPEEIEGLAEASMMDLRRALAQVPYFRNARTRHLYLDAFALRLANELNRAVRFSKTDDVEVDAEILLRECRRIPGALAGIPKDFPVGDHDGRELQRVEAMINHLTQGRLMLDRERSELFVLIRHWADPVIRKAARRAQPGPPVDEAVPDDALAVIRWVESRSQGRDGLPRIIEFAEDLAVHAESASATALRAWSDRLAARLRLEQAAVEALRQALAVMAEAEAGTPILTIQLAPDALQPHDQFLLEAVLDHRGQQRVVASSDEPESLDTIRARVDRVLDLTYEALDDDEAALRVEVIVPRVLLTEPIDQWQLEEAISVPIGEKLPLVLRSFDRMRNRRLRSQWGHKWRLAQEQSHPTADAMFYIGPEDTPSARTVYENISPDEKLALALGRAPARQPNTGPADAFSGAMQAGIAYVVWVRELSLADEFRTAMHRLLGEIPVRDLPARIAQWRAPGSAGVDPATTALAKHISLLACDHDRREPVAGRTLGPPPRRFS